MKLHTPEAAYTPQSYDALLELEDFSHDAMRTHIGLYEGYVKNTNHAQELIRGDKLGDYERAEVRRRFVWEFNGMRLHELYFDALRPGGHELDPGSDLASRLEREFGSLNAWANDFRATGSMRGIGWAALSYDAAQARFFNHWINEHDAGALAGTTPILLMDVFEHAFIRDFGMDREAYMDALLANVDWRIPQERFTQATTR